MGSRAVAVNTTIRGGADNDLIQIAGDELATTTTTAVDGEAPSNVATGDTLLFYPGNPNTPVTQVGDVPAGSGAKRVAEFVDFEPLCRLGPTPAACRELPCAP